jgi:hypothetical protein
MPISDFVTLRNAYVTANKALATCQKAQMPPEPRVYEKAYEAYQQALNAYNVEADLVANCARWAISPGSQGCLPVDMLPDAV